MPKTKVAPYGRVMGQKQISASLVTYRCGPCAEREQADEGPRSDPAECGECGARDPRAEDDAAKVARISRLYAQREVARDQLRLALSELNSTGAVAQLHQRVASAGYRVEQALAALAPEVA